MMLARRVALAVAAAALATATVSAQRPPDPQSDLQGLWTNGTVTPLQRPDDFKDKPFLTPGEAAEYERTAIERLRSQITDELDKKFAPDLDETFLETHTMKVVDGLRTSLIVDPADGKLPPQLPAAKERAAARPKQSYDDPETVGLDERCLLEVALGSSNAAPPMVPNVFGQNFYQFVQTRDYVMILTEVVHDARIIRIGGTHLPSSVQKWLGDSIGHWEGSTLVVDTTNFTPKSHFAGSGERLHVVERFSLQGPDTIRYRVTVEDPDTWATPWTAEIPFKRTSEQIYEYACHEGNRAVENYLRGARAEEQRAGTP